MFSIRFVLAFCLFVAPTLAQPCEPNWATDFDGGDPIAHGNAIASFDDGSGARLYVLDQNHLWATDGTSWELIGSLLGGAALQVFDDGTGPALFVGGGFRRVTAKGKRTDSEGIVKWDGSVWSPVEGLDIQHGVRALEVFDDGTGPALFVGGGLRSAGGQSVGNIAKWDGTTWSPLGEGVDRDVHALAVFDTGDGPELFVGGSFYQAGPVQTSGIARWDGSRWQALAGGLENGEVNAMVPFDTGAGEVLVAAGRVSNNVPGWEGSISTWDGAAWTPLNDPSGQPGFNNTVDALAVFDTGNGPTLAAGGQFSTASGSPVAGVAQYIGIGWAPLGGGITSDESWVRGLFAFDDGTGPALYVTGDLWQVAGIPVSSLACWDGSEWCAIVGEREGGVPFRFQPKAAATLDDGAGEALFVGSLRHIGATAVGGVARFDGKAWESLGEPYENAEIRDFAVLTQPERQLFAAGERSHAGPTDVIAAWRGGHWEPLPNSVFDVDVGQGIYALAVFDDGTGQALYAGGNFEEISGVEMNHIARWDGQQWHPLVSGSQVGIPGTHINDLIVFDDGAGPALYAIGNIDRPVLYVAKWDGSDWTPLYGPSGGQNAALVFDDGSGPKLYVAGIGGAYLLQGTQLVQVGEWIPVNWVNALVGFDDGSGHSLFAVGTMELPGRPETRGVLKLVNNEWQDLGGLDDGAWAAAVFQNSLYLTGSFTSAGGVPSRHIARLDQCRCYADCDQSTGTGTLDIFDFLCFQDLFTSGDPEADCDGSGELDAFDFLCFQDAFAIGCH